PSEGHLQDRPSRQRDPAPPQRVPWVSASRARRATRWRSSPAAPRFRRPRLPLPAGTVLVRGFGKDVRDRGGRSVLGLCRCAADAVLGWCESSPYSEPHLGRPRAGEFSIRHPHGEKTKFQMLGGSRCKQWLSPASL
ncbi:hypothetical protein EI555_012035, partial [Monodon monoceros]